MNNQSMNLIETIRTRYSCRTFADTPLLDNDLQTIAEAAATSPSAMNRQPWQIVVVKNKSLVDEMEAAGMAAIQALPDPSIFQRIQGRGGKLFYNAPSMIVLSVKTVETNGFEMLDCGIVTQTVALAAKALGIDSLICGLAKFAFAGEKGEAFKQRLGFAAGYDFGIAVLLGYATEPNGQPHEIDLGKIVVVE